MERSWEKLSPRKKLALTLSLVAFALLTFCLALGVSENRADESATPEGLQIPTWPDEPYVQVFFDACDAYVADEGVPFNFIYEGVGCNKCNHTAYYEYEDLSDVSEYELSRAYLNLQECNNTCSKWTIESRDARLFPVLETCSFYIDDSENLTIDNSTLCAPGYISQRTNCDVDNINDILLFKDESHFWMECYNTHVLDHNSSASNIYEFDCRTLREDLCVELCEELSDCAGYVVDEYGRCFTISDKIEHLCQVPDEEALFCKKGSLILHCLENTSGLAYAEAEEQCEEMDGHLPIFDDIVTKDRLIASCLDGDNGCWLGYDLEFNSSEVQGCVYMKQETGLASSDCLALRSVCCQLDTGKPTVSPTSAPSATGAPTSGDYQTPIKTTIPLIFPEPLCTYSNGESLWRVSNENEIDSMSLPFAFFFPYSDRVEQVINPKQYQACSRKSKICVGHSWNLVPQESVFFTVPSDEILYLTTCSLNTTCTRQAHAHSASCHCNTTELFVDDFQALAAGSTIRTGSSFFDIWQTLEVSANIRIEGMLQDEATPSSEFLTSPCRTDTKKCINFNGRISTRPEPINLGISKTEMETSVLYFERKCTLNLWVAGNSRCGNNSAYSTATDVYENGCLAPLYDSFVATRNQIEFGFLQNSIDESSATFDIRWNHTWTKFGYTVAVPENGTLEAFLATDGRVNVNDGTIISPFIGSVDISCCCPGANDVFPSYVMDYQQGPTRKKTAVNWFKSNPNSILKRPPNRFGAFGQIFSLGLGGYSVFEFEHGFSSNITLYEQSYVSHWYKPNEDARVEVSVDGTTWKLLADSLESLEWKTFCDYGIRSVVVEISNGACYKFLRITDSSAATCEASDGFDLHAIVAGETCCPSSGDGFKDEADRKNNAKSLPGESTVSGVVTFLFFCSFMSVGGLVVIGIIHIRNRKNKAEISIGGEMSTHENFANNPMCQSGPVQRQNNIGSDDTSFTGSYSSRSRRCNIITLEDL